MVDGVNGDIEVSGGIRALIGSVESMGSLRSTGHWGQWGPYGVSGVNGEIGGNGALMGSVRFRHHVTTVAACTSAVT